MHIGQILDFCYTFFKNIYQKSRYTGSKYCEEKIKCVCPRSKINRAQIDFPLNGDAHSYSVVDEYKSSKLR